MVIFTGYLEAIHLKRLIYEVHFLLHLCGIADMACLIPHASQDSRHGPPVVMSGKGYTVWCVWASDVSSLLPFCDQSIGKRACHVSPL